ncbi:hypothetical protein [Salinigranum rubrum]|uniref:hypothetical protein n=1 Tax=Salinigranum rubrum TaxID=755307 RepID=UPI0013A591F0|nr:hypothetical protein [Salinigranum rubrum]
MADEGPDVLQQFRDAVSYEFFINGEPIGDATTHWNDIRKYEGTEHWHLRWEYATPPQSIGLHDFRVRKTFDRPLYYPDSTGEDKLWQGVVEEESTYNVVKDNRPSTLVTSLTHECGVDPIDFVQ